MHESLVGRGTFMQRLQYSKAVQAVLNEHVRNANFQHIVDGTRVKNLRAAAHRFESCQRPYVRAVLHFEGLIGTATAVMRGRAGRKEAKIAASWLEGLSTEFSLQMAMMGDAGDETLQLVRLFDSEAFDVTKLHQALADYHTRLNALFRNGLCLQTGLTSTMLETLRKNAKLVHVNGEMRQIGGVENVTDDVIARCLGRMAAWCELGEEISEAEFPNFEILQALHPFDLEPLAKRGVAAMVGDSDGFKEAISRVCALCLSWIRKKHLMSIVTMLRLPWNIGSGPMTTSRLGNLP